MIALSYFVPIVLAMGGNTGIQSSTLVVRSIALGTFEGRSVFKTITREIATGALMGIICGTLIGLWAHFIFLSDISNGEPLAFSPIHLALVVASALFSAMTFATVFGALVPVLLNKANIDPAVASGPFVTIANDISALLIYFGVTTAMIHGFYNIL